MAEPAVSYRLLTWKQQPVLQSVATGEMAPLRGNSARLIDDPSGTLVELETEGQMITTSVGDWLKLKLVHGENGSWVEKPTGERITAQEFGNEFEVKALKMKLPHVCSGLAMQTEVFHFAMPQVNHYSVFWVLRWLVFYLGGHPNSNFLGDSIGSWSNKLQVYLAMLCSSGEEVAPSHFNKSLEAEQALVRSRREDTLENRAMEFCCSSFALVALLGTWAGRGFNQKASWTEPRDMVQLKCSALLSAMLTTFVTHTARSQSGEGDDRLDLYLVVGSCDAEVGIHWEQLVASPGAAAQQKRQPLFKGEQVASLHTCILALAKDECLSTLSKARKAASTRVLAELFRIVADLVEASKVDSLWGEYDLHQLEQVKTARGHGKNNFMCLQSSNGESHEEQSPGQRRLCGGRRRHIQ